MTPGETRGKKHKVSREPQSGRYYFLYRPPQSYGAGSYGAYNNVLLPVPPVSPGVIIVMIPQFCGTGPFGSDIKITIASKINVEFLKSATAELEKKIENLPIEARDCKSRAAV